MNYQTTYIESYRHSSLGLVAWTCATLTFGIFLAIVGVTAVLVVNKATAGLDPLPQIRWSDVR